MEDSTESEEGSSCPSQSQSQSEGLESKEDNTKRHPQPQEDLHITHLLAAQDPVWPLLQPKNPQKSMPKTNKRDHYMPSSNYPDHWVSHEEDRGQQHISVHVDVKANKHQIKQAVK